MGLDSAELHEYHAIINQHHQVEETALTLAEIYGIDSNVLDWYIGPPIPEELMDNEIMATKQNERRKKLELLPTELRTAINRMYELVELKAVWRTYLLQQACLCEPKMTLNEAAEALWISVVDVCRALEAKKVKKP
jgi:hypothetical protein